MFRAEFEGILILLVLAWEWLGGGATQHQLLLYFIEIYFHYVYWPYIIILLIRYLWYVTTICFPTLTWGSKCCLWLVAERENFIPSCLNYC